MKTRHIIGLIFIVILLALPLVVVQFNNGNQIEFISYKFTEEYWKFLGTLASVAFGFYLVNILWAEKEIGELINQTKRLLLNYLLRINKTCQAILDLLTKPFSEVNYDESQKRDIEILHLIEIIMKAGMALENTTIDIRAFRDDPVKEVYIEIVWDDLLPCIDRLSSITNFRIDYDEFSDTLIKIKALSEKGQKELSNSR
jgi:hypothetical protein